MPLWLKVLLLGAWILVLMIGIFVVLIVDDNCASPSMVNVSDIMNSNQQYLKNPNQADIVVSFTTMPDRLQSNSFRKSVSAMLEQSVRPREIRVNIPYRSKRTGKEYIVPEWLNELQPHVVIVRCEDLGPATKYIHTLQHFANNPNQRILIYDDDSIMPSDLVENFDKNSMKYPDYCFTTTSYRFIPGKSNETKFLHDNPQFNRMNLSSKLTLFKRIGMWLIGHPEQDLSDRNEGDHVLTDVVVGWTGYLLKPKMLHLKDVSDFDLLPKEAFFVDDIVISGALAKQGTRVAVGSNLDYPKKTIEDFSQWIWDYTIGTSNESLSTGVNKNGRNDHVMEHFYRSYWHFI